MELIANLRNSSHTEGLTGRRLKYLEQIFRDAANDKQEVDVDHFKNIVQTKNMFFVERIFRIFDENRSGWISLEDFMRVLRNVAKQKPREKLRYLFDVYDLNNDGFIQYDELKNVIRECMKENGLRFKDEEIDELTKMLFENADTDGSGSINFDEFRGQLERYPAFLENVTLSIDRWFIPPVALPSKRRLLRIFSHKTLTWKYIKNNWSAALFLLIYIIVNFMLFISRAYQYRNFNTYVIIARACGQCLNFNCAFIVILILRQTLTWMRTHGFSRYFPIDHHLFYHKLIGFFIVMFSLLHTCMHIANFAILSWDMNVPLHELLSSTRFDFGWVGGAACLTGWVLLVILMIMFISALPFVRRTGKFEVFYYLHFLSIVFWVILILHGPSFWMWFLVPGVLYFIEILTRIRRNVSTSKTAYVQQGVLLPSKVTHLVIKRPPKFEYRPGDYVYINIPSIAKFEWHPFTISSAPELDDVIWLHVRGVGEWTNSLYEYFERRDKEAVLSDELAKNLELDLSLKNDGHDKVSIDTKYSNISSLPSSVVEDNMSLASRTNKGFEDSSLNLTPPSLNETIVQVDNLVSHEDISNNLGTNKDDSKEAAFSGEEQVQQKDIVGSRKSSLDSNLSKVIVSDPVHGNDKNDITIAFEHKRSSLRFDDFNRKSHRKPAKEKRRSVRVSVAKKGLRRCQTVVIMPTINECDVGTESTKSNLTTTVLKTKEGMDSENQEENIVIAQKPLKVFLDGPYGSPTRHIFQARHAVLIGTGIGVTPFASILQSIMYLYKISRHTCPSCHHKWSDPVPISSLHLKKVDFFWLNRHQQAFEWFVSLLSELEVEQAELEEKDRFLDIHMYITSALSSCDMKAVGLQMALDLLYQKEMRCLITGLKSRTQPGRPDWDKVFASLAQQQKGKITVFFCGPAALAKTLQRKCDEFGFSFRKETF